MAYAELDDVRARAGRLAGAFTVAGKRPNEADLTEFLTDVAAEIDAWIESRGFTASALDAATTAALKDLNAYGALLRGLEGLAPSAEVERVLARAGAVWTSGSAALSAGTFGAMAVLEAGRGGSAGSSAGDLWSEEPTSGTYATVEAEATLLRGTDLAPAWSKGQSL